MPDGKSDDRSAWKKMSKLRFRKDVFMRTAKGEFKIATHIRFIPKEERETTFIGEPKQR